MARLVLTLTLVFTCFVTSVTLAEDVEITGADAFTIRQKTTCGTTEPGQVRYGIFEGRVYSRVPGEKDKHIFNLLGINTRHCMTTTDDKRGRGFRSISREIMVYMDPETGEVIDQWDNPWTGKSVPVLHVANDPVNMRAIAYEVDEDGESRQSFKGRRYGDVIARSAEIPLFYKNPLGGEYQPYVGGTYHAMEIFNSFYDAKKLLNSRTKSIGQSHLSWSRVAKWLPWLEMGDKPGIMIFNANGFSTFERNRIPKKLMAILEDRYPLYLEPPELTDSRPNETSWTVFKKYMEKQRSE